MFITAEVGINHNGDIEIAKKLINMAIRCGVDAVKFQKRTIERCYTQEFLNSPRESPWGTTQRAQKMGLEFGEREYDEIDAYCRQHGIDWYASAWDVESQIFLRKYNLKYNKIASKMASDKELVQFVAEERKPVFLSTGLNNNALLDWAVGSLSDCPVTLMHCVMKYPCPANECHLSRIRELGDIYSLPIGYSSHFPGILDAPIAVSLGAVAIEKHITLDRAMYGTDQSSSLEERGLYLAVRDARMVEQMSC